MHYEIFQEALVAVGQGHVLTYNLKVHIFWGTKFGKFGKFNTGDSQN